MDEEHGRHGGAASASIMMAFWNHPFFMIDLDLVDRSGSAAVAAEIERGRWTCSCPDPISRIGLYDIAGPGGDRGHGRAGTGPGAGASLAVRYNVLREPPGFWMLLQPAINLGALGLPIYGYTLLAASIDHVRWRPSWVGIDSDPRGLHRLRDCDDSGFRNMWWRPWLERVSLFKAYNPVELVIKGESLSFNLAILGGIGTSCILWHSSPSPCATCRPTADGGRISRERRKYVDRRYRNAAWDSTIDSTDGVSEGCQ